jgi:YHS domain-containing protein
VDGQFLREFEGRLYLFTTKENWDTFKAAPQRYVLQKSTKENSVVSR